VASVHPRAQAMLQEVGALASSLSLPATCSDVGCTVDSFQSWWSRFRRQMLTAFVKFRASVEFCLRGLRVTGQDVLEVCTLMGAAASRKRRPAGRSAPRTRLSLSWARAQRAEAAPTPPQPPYPDGL